MTMSQFKRVEDGIFIGPSRSSKIFKKPRSKGSGRSSIFGCHPRPLHQTRH